MPVKTASQEFNKNYFKQTLEKQSLNHAYIFSGPPGAGKIDLALWLAQAFFCEQGQDGEACGNCSSCQKINQDNHPDLVYLEADGASIKVDQIRQLVERMSKTGVEGKGQVVIINEADKMTTGASNALLKALEEPADHTLILLLTQTVASLLSTIRSRAQEVTFLPLSQQACAATLVDQGVGEDQANLLSQLTQDPDQAMAWLEDEDFLDLVRTSQSFYAYLQKGSDLAIPYVQSDMVKKIKDQPGQDLSLEILLALFRKQLHAGKDQSALASRQLAHCLKAIKMFQAHVSYQSVLEYLAMGFL